MPPPTQGAAPAAAETTGAQDGVLLFDGPLTDEQQRALEAHNRKRARDRARERRAVARSATDELRQQTTAKNSNSTQSQRRRSCVWQTRAFGRLAAVRHSHDKPVRNETFYLFSPV